MTSFKSRSCKSKRIKMSQQTEALTDEELLQEAKKMKLTKLYDAGIVGFLAGVAIYSTVTNGFGLLTFLPLVYVPIAGRNNKKRKELEKQLKARNLS